MPLSLANSYLFCFYLNQGFSFINSFFLSCILTDFEKLLSYWMSELEQERIILGREKPNLKKKKHLCLIYYVLIVNDRIIKTIT